MIYLTNDSHDQAVYFDIRKNEPRRRTGGVEHLVHGLVGNGVTEVPVTVRTWRDCQEVNFGGAGIFSFVDERTIRRMLADLVQEIVLH